MFLKVSLLPGSDGWFHLNEFQTTEIAFANSSKSVIWQVSHITQGVILPATCRMIVRV